MPSGVYKKKEEQKRKISETLKRKYKEGLLKSGFQKGDKIRLGMKNNEKQKKTASKTMKKNNPMKPGMQPVNSKNWKGENHPLYGIKRIDMIKENNPNWKGGITPLRQEIYHCSEYKKWRKKVFERDDYTCQECRVKSGEGKSIYLEAHHIRECYKIIKSNNIKTLEEALNCKELWDTNNGITLCKDCHNKTKGFIANQYVKK